MLIWLRLARAALRRVIGLALATGVVLMTAAGGDDVDMLDLLARRFSGFWISSISKLGLVSPSTSSLISISSSSLSENSSFVTS